MNGPNLVLESIGSGLVVLRKIGKPYYAWSAPSMTVLIASLDAAA